MSQVKAFKKVDIQAATCEDTFDDSPLVLEHAGPWIADGKYQEREYVLREVATGNFYRYTLSRSGSPFSDYFYSWEREKDMIELCTVVKTTKVVEVWE